MYKAVNKAKKQEGFTLIELLIVVAIIGILAAIAIPGYIGMQERGRMGGINRGVSTAVPELQMWLSAAKDGSAASWVDSNGDGATGPALNSALAAEHGKVSGLCTQFMGVPPRSTQTSPWGSASLWTTTAALKGTTDGQISCTHVKDGNILLVALDGAGTEVARQTVSAD